MNDRAILRELEARLQEWGSCLDTQIERAKAISPMANVYFLRGRKRQTQATLEHIKQLLKSPEQLSPEDISIKGCE
jgi:hypothetical protein